MRTLCVCIYVGISVTLLHIHVCTCVPIHVYIFSTTCAMMLFRGQNVFWGTAPSLLSWLIGVQGCHSGSAVHFCQCSSALQLAQGPPLYLRSSQSEVLQLNSSIWRMSSLCCCFTYSLPSLQALCLLSI